jgi:hypothetical protein
MRPPVTGNDFSQLLLNGNEQFAIPYRYRIG